MSGKIHRRAINGPLVTTTLKLRPLYWKTLKMAASNSEVGAVTLIESFIESLPEFHVAEGLNQMYSELD